MRFQRGAEFFLPLTELSILGYVEHPFIIEIGYSTFARNTLTPPLPPSPITNLSLHPASFPYSLISDECPAVGWFIPRGPGQFPIMKINRQKILNTEREKMSTLLVRWEVDYGERIGGSPKSGAGLGGAILHVRGKDSAMG